MRKVNLQSAQSIMIGKDKTIPVKKLVRLERCCVTGRVVTMKAPGLKFHSLEPHVHFHTKKTLMHVYNKIPVVHETWKPILGGATILEEECTIVLSALSDDPEIALREFMYVLDFKSPHVGASLNAGAMLSMKGVDDLISNWTQLNLKMFSLPAWGYMTLASKLVENEEEVGDTPSPVQKILIPKAFYHDKRREKGTLYCEDLRPINKDGDILCIELDLSRPEVTLWMHDHDFRNSVYDFGYMDLPQFYRHLDSRKFGPVPEYARKFLYDNLQLILDESSK